MDITDAIREYAREKTQRLDRFFDRITRIQIILNAEGDNYSVEMVMSVSRSTLVSHETNGSLYAAIDLVMDKSERLLTKHKEKLRGHRVRKSDAVGGGGVEPKEAGETELDLEKE